MDRVNKPATQRKFEIDDFERIDRCPWCDSPESKQWGMDQPPFNTVECAGCGLVYVNNRLNTRGREKYYSSYFSQEHQAVPEAKVRYKMYKLEFDYIHKYVKGGKILDIGCSGGEFLDYFNEAGFDCYGVEVGEEAARIAQKKYGDRIIHSSLLNAEIKNSFDLILMRGTIEHIPEAKETLVKAIRLLDKKNRAHFYITSTPNLASISASIFKTNWTQHLPEEHLYHFKKEHLDKFFNEFGFNNIASHHFYEETPYANVEDDIMIIAGAIKLKRQNKHIEFKSPAFYGNMMSLVYCNENK